MDLFPISPSMPNLQPPFEAYQGDYPFIFVSYTHKDGAQVYPEIQYLHSQGYRVWYDEGIEPGSEWPEYIEKALQQCTLFLVYITPRAVESHNVRKEIHYAISHRKRFLAVYLEQTALVRGMELQMSDLQAILKYGMPHERYLRLLSKALTGNLRDGLRIPPDGTRDVSLLSAQEIPKPPDLAFSGQTQSRERTSGIQTLGQPAFCEEANYAFIAAIIGVVSMLMTCGVIGLPMGIFSLYMTGKASKKLTENPGLSGQWKATIARYTSLFVILVSVILIIFVIGVMMSGSNNPKP